jgi:hypothetical protein
MSQSSAVASTDRLGLLEEEVKRHAALLKTANNHISVLQMVLLLAAMGLGGGAYYLITTGKLRVEGFSPPVASTVEAKEFGLYNRFGTRVVFDGDDRFGQPRVTFLDDQKRLQMRLMVLPDGGGTGAVAVYDHTGWRGMFRMEADKSSSLKLVGEGLKGGIAMTVDRDGQPSLKLTDKTGKVLWEAPTKSN